ncbi:MAG TPA: hypothetical protein VFK50_02455 [Sphingomicrobium sp.]|nr:hypothetical protein [Sphingomicrobium sp.]
MGVVTTHIGLAIELLLSSIMIVITTIIHGTGIGLMDRFIRTDRLDLSKLRLVQREVGVMIPMALFLLVLHIIEIFIFAIFYLATGDADTLHEAIYHSALAYTTMGVVEGGFTKWLVLSTFEGLVGFLMIGWSSAVFVTEMDGLLRNRRK